MKRSMLPPPPPPPPLLPPDGGGVVGGAGVFAAAALRVMVPESLAEFGSFVESTERVSV